MNMFLFAIQIGILTNTHTYTYARINYLKCLPNTEHLAKFQVTINKLHLEISIKLSCDGIVIRNGLNVNVMINYAKYFLRNMVAEAFFQLSYADQWCCWCEHDISIFFFSFYEYCAMKRDAWNNADFN